MRNLCVISLLAVTMYNSVGFIVSFQVFRSAWRQHVRQHLADSLGKKDLSVFHFHKNNVQAKKHEFQINGEYYDVISCDILGDSVIVRCFADKKETALVAQFQGDIQKNIAQKTDFQDKTTFIFHSLIKEFIFEYYHHLQYPPSVSELFDGKISYRDCFIYTCFLDIEAPPPQYRA